MDVLVMIAVAAVVLSFLVFIHEGGHYLASRAFGVRVTEFMIGLPGPRISFRRGETEFGLTAIPLGGYARVCGMEAGEENPHLPEVLAAIYRRGTANAEDIAKDCGISVDDAMDALDELVEWGCCVPPRKTDQHNTYRTVAVQPTKRQQRRAARRIRTQFAGGMADYLALSADCAAGAGDATGVATGDAAATGAIAHSTARAKAPLPSYREGQPRPVGSVQALYQNERSQQYRAKPFWQRIIILLAGIFMNILFAMLAFIIIYSVIGFDYAFQDGTVRHVVVTPLQSIQAGITYIGMVAQAIANLFNPAMAADTVQNSTSIVGIAIMSKTAAEEGLVSLLTFTAMISVSLGLMNLLPIPPLDGGRFVMEIIQLIVRRPVSARVNTALTVAGVVLFMGFFVLMVGQDITRVFTGFWS